MLLPIALKLHTLTFKLHDSNLSIPVRRFQPNLQAVDEESLQNDGIEMPLEDQLGLMTLGESKDPKDGYDLTMFKQESASTKVSDVTRRARE